MQKELKILCVDDEPNILDSFRRQLRGKYDLELATSASKALELLKAGQRFSVIVSDMRMPGMDGVELLKNFQKLSPLTVRVMLTGNVDQDTASKAVNEGQIFRFVNKPCSPGELERILDAATQQFRLLSAEKDLLQNTLSGSIRVLTEILSLSDPIAFGIASAIREPVREMAKMLQLKNSWELDLAAMLHPIGWVTVPEAIKTKYRKGEELNTEERKMIERVPELGSQFVGSIPRLENVAQIILHSERAPDGHGQVVDGRIREGAKIIQIAKGLVTLELAGHGRSAALTELKQRSAEYDLDIIDRLLASGEQPASLAVRSESYAIQPNQLCPGQRLTENLFCGDGRLLIAAGAYLSELMCKRIINYAMGGNLKLPIMVDTMIPQSNGKEKVGDK